MANPLRLLNQKPFAFFEFVSLNWDLLRSYIRVGDTSSVGFAATFPRWGRLNGVAIVCPVIPLAFGK